MTAPHHRFRIGPAEETGIDGVFLDPDEADLACGTCRTVLVCDYRPRAQEVLPACSVVLCPECGTRNRLPERRP